MQSRAAALHAFECQFFGSLVANLQKAEAFFLQHSISLRSSIHAAISSRDPASARALKRKIKSREAFVVLNMNGFDKVTRDACVAYVTCDMLSDPSQTRHSAARAHTRRLLEDGCVEERIVHQQRHSGAEG